MIGPARWSEKYMRIPFVELGFTKEGCHCWGLVWLVYRNELKVDLPKYDMISAKETRRMMKAMGSEIDTGSWRRIGIDYKPFDIAIMTGLDVDDEGKSRGTVERHVGVYAGPNHVLHIEEGIDSTCAALNQLGFKNRIRRIYRHTSQL